MQGLSRVATLNADRKQRAAELHGKGHKVVGFLCCYPPVELLTALDLVPYRIQGNAQRPIVAADSYLETTTCSFIRSCLDMALCGEYDFLDGLIVPHSCDTVQRIYDIWRCWRPTQFHHCLTVPHMVQPSSFVFFEQELSRLQRALERFVGRQLEVAALRASIDLHNDNRAMLRQLYEYRKTTPPRLKGSEVLRIVVAGMGLPVVEFNQLLSEVIAEVQEREPVGPKRPRVLIYGSEIDDAGFIELLEQAGADVVADDLCTGSRAFWHDVPITVNPLEGLTVRYLGSINCPRTYRPRQPTRSADLDARFGYLRHFVADFHVEAIVCNIMRFCDTHELDVPDVVDYFSAQQVPVLHLEEEYRVANVGQIVTRAEAFLETIGD